MTRKHAFFTLGLVLAVALASAATAAPGKPDFEARIYADGTAWGTKATTMLPPANDHNVQSFDKLFVITNGNNPMEQLPVSEASPGNPDYNGGRWYTHTVMWTEAGLAAHNPTPILKSYEEIMHHHDLGHLSITAGSPPDGPPDFFSCPLLPVK